MLKAALVLALGAPTWERDIQPLFDAECRGCHSAKVTMGSLDLETYEGLRRGGNNGFIVTPGKPAESRLYTMLTGEEAPAMPMGRLLPAAQIEMVSSWIAAGALGPQVKQAYSLAWKPDGGGFAIGGYKRVTFSGNTPEWAGLSEAVRAVAYSKDGSKLLAAGGVPGKFGEVAIQNGPTFKGHSDCIYAAAFSPDGATIATASYDKLIKLWDAASGKEIRTLKDHIDAVYALAFTPDGKRLISGAADRTVKVWNPATGERLYTMGEPADGINALAISPDGKMVAAGGLDKNIRLWRLGEKSAELVSSQIAHEDAILKLAFTLDGKRLISTAADRTLKIFNVPDLSENKQLPGQTDWITGMAVSPDGKTLAVVRINGSTQTYPLE
jgi:WD40 repeat protein